MKSNEKGLLNRISINDFQPIFVSLCRETKLVTLFFEQFWIYQDLTKWRFDSPVNFSGHFAKVVLRDWTDIFWKHPIVQHPSVSSFLANNLYGCHSGELVLQGEHVNFWGDLELSNFLEPYVDEFGTEETFWFDFTMFNPKVEIEILYDDLPLQGNEYFEEVNTWQPRDRGTPEFWSQLAKTPEDFAKVPLDDFIKFITNKTPRELNLQSNRIREFENFLTEQGIPFEPTPEYDWQK